MKKRIISLASVLCMLIVFCSPVVATDSHILVELEGRTISVYSTSEENVIDTTVYIYDFETQTEASDEIYNSYSSFCRTRGGDYNEWEYASRTVVCYLNTGQILNLYNAYAEISTGASGVQTISARVRMYSQDVTTVSITNTPVADSGTTTVNYAGCAYAEASTYSTVNSAIATFTAYQPGYGTFTATLKAEVP